MKQILACVPVDRSVLPQCQELDAVVITDLYTLKHCAVRDCPVWVGPRQLALYNNNPNEFVIMCMTHALAVQEVLNGPLDPERDVTELGGGYPVEGRARIS